MPKHNFKKNVLSIAIPLLLIILCILYFTFNNKRNTSVSKSALKLNTYITVTLYGTDNTQILDEVFALCDYYEQLFSKTIQTSDVYQFNHRTTQGLKVNESTAELVMYGLSYSTLSNGAFDIAIGRLTDLWDFTAKNPVLPNETTLSNARLHVGYQSLSIADSYLYSTDDGLEIDLGGIAKGYIADRMKDFLISKGITSGMINLGGNVLCIGSKPDGSPFKVGVQKPFSEQGETLLAIDVVDYSVVSSGTYERYFNLNDMIYHHILNPLTGYPYNNGLTAVTILSKQSVDGDGLSTTCFSLGLEEGMKLINSLDETYAIFVTDNGQIYYSDGLQDHFPITKP
ncbi:FAD:protein FMN transferase [Anaerosporobacter sp.]|uniref:FAD:protein FMN transferase n=1 Tax=Anaerosporobacter sp. TaxID=1872529 RepID=UPI00286F4529|nr:FAD:protein FMN transferase [Anaerosporobacter sp.]